MDVKIKAGFPPKYLQVEDESCALSSVTSISPRDNLIVELVPSAEQGKSSSKPTFGKQKISPSNYSKIPQQPKGPFANQADGQIVRRAMPSDNSCLFHSVSYCLAGYKARDHSEYASELRKVIADNVSNNPELFTDAFLGQKPLDYQKFILQKDSWGGGIELSILSRFYEIEICAFDIKTARVNRFGEGERYKAMIFLIYDGVHYDALAMALDEKVEMIDCTVFSSDDQQAIHKALEYVRREQTQRNYTDLNGFGLRCMTCGAVLKGQNEAQQHAQQTGHQNFGQAS